MMKKVLFYSSVTDKKLFHIQQFYQIDITLLEEMDYEVLLSNSIYDAWKFWKYDFVFAYFYRYAFFVAFVAKLFGKNTYFTGGIDALDKNYSSPKNYKIQKWFFKLCYWLSKSCIIVSKTDDANVREICNGAKLSYSEHTIDTRLFLCDTDIKEDIFVTIGWQANLGNVIRKGMDIAIRLFAKLHELPDYENAVFYVIGKTGEGTEYLKRIVEELGIRDIVKFTGSVEESEKVRYLKRAKYYFQLSKYEGFGVAALEALCSKCIVIHSGKGGLNNPIYDNGVLIDIDKPVDDMFEELKTKLASFDSKKLENGCREVCDRYDNERRKEDFKRIFVD